MGKTGCFLVLALALVTLSTSSERKCILSGSWKNELGSNMTIDAMDKAGHFSGHYLTAVSGTSTQIKQSPLNGSQHIENLENSTFGFTVKWNITDSTTVWVGQCFVDEHGEETLRTMWLLRERVATIGDDWKATTVGTNTFTRLKKQDVRESPKSNL